MLFAWEGEGGTRVRGWQPSGGGRQRGGSPWTVT